MNFNTLKFILIFSFISLSSYAQPKPYKVEAVSRYGEVYFSSALPNLHFYLLQFKNKYYSGLNAEEQRAWDTLIEICKLNNYRIATGQKHINLQPSYDQNMFILQGVKEPRLAVTYSFEQDPERIDPIYINPKLFPEQTLADKFTYAHAVELLIHELGHKIPGETQSATDKIASIIFNEIQAATLQKDTPEGRYSILQIDSDNLKELPEDELPLRSDEVFVFFKMKTGLQYHNLTPLVTPKILAKDQQNIFFKFNRTLSSTVGPTNSSFKLPLSYNIFFKSRNKDTVFGPIKEIQQVYNVNLYADGSNLNFRYTEGSVVDLSYSFKTESTHQSPNLIELTGIIEGPNIADQLEITSLDIEKTGQEFYKIESIKKEVLDSDHVRVTYRLKNINTSVDTGPLKSTSIYLKLKSNLQLKIFLDAPISWDLLAHRKVKVSKNKINMEISPEFTLNSTFGSAMDKAGVIFKVSGLNGAELHDFRALLIIKVILKATGQEVSLPNLFYINVTAENTKYSIDKNEAYVKIPMNEMFSVQRVHDVLSNDFDYESVNNSDVDFTVSLASGLVTDKNLRTYEVAANNLQVTFNGNATFNENFTKAAQCSKLFR